MFQLGPIKVPGYTLEITNSLVPSETFLPYLYTQTQGFGRNTRRPKYPWTRFAAPNRSTKMIWLQQKEWPTLFFWTRQSYFEHSSIEPCPASTWIVPCTIYMWKTSDLSEGQRFRSSTASTAHALLDQRHRELLMWNAVFCVTHILGFFVGYMIMYAQQYVFLQRSKRIER